MKATFDHITIVKDKETFRVYVNGTQEKELLMRDEITVTKYRLEQISNSDLHECIGILAGTNILITTYEEVEEDVPQWLTVQKRRLVRRIKEKQDEALEREYAMAKSQLASAQMTKDPEASAAAKVTALEERMKLRGLA
jgi:hypothetical protein